MTLSESSQFPDGVAFRSMMLLSSDKALLVMEKLLKDSGALTSNGKPYFNPAFLLNLTLQTSQWKISPNNNLIISTINVPLLPSLYIDWPSVLSAHRVFVLVTCSSI